MSLVAQKRGNFKNAPFTEEMGEENLMKGFIRSAKGASLLRAPNFTMKGSG